MDWRLSPRYLSHLCLLRAKDRQYKGKLVYPALFQYTKWLWMVLWIPETHPYTQTHCKKKIPIWYSKGKSVPLQTRSGPEGSRKLRFPDFMTTAQDGGKVVSLTHRPPLPPGNAPGTNFCYRLGRPQGHSAIGRILCQRNIPMTPAGIEPATFRLHDTLVYEIWTDLIDYCLWHEQPKNEN